MTYYQITSEERYTIAALRREGFCSAEIARRLGRHRSTISREVTRNSSRSDGCYRPSKAIERTNGRRARSRRNQYFTKADFALVEKKLKADWSPEQLSGHLRLHGELSITADNGTEFHDYESVEEATGVKFYFATPYHSWERDSNENFNGLLRQYLPKRTSQAALTQRDCDRIANKLNSRPRKRLGYRTPEERFHGP